MTPEHVTRFETAVEALNRLKWWIIAIALTFPPVLAGGCVAYIRSEVLELRLEIAKLREERYTVARILSMMKEDPKNFKRNDAQIEAVKEYERTRATSGRPSGGGR